MATTEIQKVAKQFVREMMPSGGAVGVDLGSMAYKDMMDHYLGEFPDITRDELETEIRALFKEIHENLGFGVLSEE